MKNKIFTFLILIFLSNVIFAQTNGVLDVSVNTSSAGGNYAPRNILAIWIENENGTFVKTLMAYAATYKTHLNNWEASTTAAGSPFNVVDAISGPSLTNHGTRQCSWNAKNYLGNLMPDGNYRICFELTDKNATGNYSCFVFSKDSNQITLTPPTVPSFAAINIKWNPQTASIENHNSKSAIKVFPNPTSDFVNVHVNNLISLQLFDLAGNNISTSNSDILDLRKLSSGIYLLKIETKENTVVRKVIKN